MCRVYSVFDLTVREVAACLEVNLCDLSLFFSPLPCLTSSFFSQTFMLLNASMPCLWNTPVGELIQKQGANECVDWKRKEADSQKAIFHVLGEGVMPAKLVPGLL